MTTEAVINAGPGGAAVPDPKPEESSRTSSGILGALRGQLSDAFLIAVLIVLVIVFWLSSPFFLTASNFEVIGTNIAVLVLLALPQTFLIISSNVDLSQGGVVALTSVLIGMITEAGGNVWLGALVACLVGASIGLVNGLAVVFGRINPLIVTLGTLSIATGIAFMGTDARTKMIPDESGFKFLGTGEVFNIRFPIILATLVFVLYLIIERSTVYARHLYALGGNAEAARRSGMKVSEITISAFVFCGLFAAIGGVVITSQLRAAAPQVGGTYLLLTITAVILGGTSLAGGRGTVIGTLIAALILGVLRNGFALLQFSSYAEDVALGAVLIAAVLADTRFGNKLRGET